MLEQTGAGREIPLPAAGVEGRYAPGARRELGAIPGLAAGRLRRTWRTGMTPDGRSPCVARAGESFMSGSTRALLGLEVGGRNLGPHTLTGLDAPIHMPRLREPRQLRSGGDPERHGKPP
jgi:hypothetical protein